MNALQTALWCRIDGYAFDEVDASLPFSARLARDNNWSLTFAKRAMQEYKNFVFLAVTAGHPVTPSDEVDQVWHLHLLYTRAYWEDFCKILGGPLHHGPTQGGAREGHKFHGWYENTLRSYARVFAAAPPADLWPEPAKRFGKGAVLRRIDTRACWLIPLPRLPRPVWAAVVTVPLLWLAGCDTSAETRDLGMLLPVVILMVVVWFTNKNDNNRGGGSGGGCGAGGDGGCGGCGGCGG